MKAKPQLGRPMQEERVDGGNRLRILFHGTNTKVSPILSAN